MLRNLIVFFATSLVLSIPCQALPADRTQPIEIESDRAERHEKLGRTIYAGGVVITQGTIQIKADKVTVTNLGNKVAKIVCVGTPAHYQQQPAADKGLIIARASTIEYSLDKNQISLIKNASLEQNGSTISGELIEYDLPKELVKAQGDLTGRQRIQMVIPPSAHQHEKLIEQVGEVSDSPGLVEGTLEEALEPKTADTALEEVDIEAHQSATSELVDKSSLTSPVAPAEELTPSGTAPGVEADPAIEAKGQVDPAIPASDTPQPESR